MSLEKQLVGLTAARVARALRAGEITSSALVDAYLERIARVDRGINAYVTVCAERAREAARRADQELGAGRARGPLHGVPVALKDLYATRGIRTTGGSRIHADWIPDADSTVAARLRDAGAVLLGKLATHEYAYGVTTSNPHFGPTRNPWDRARIPGGSSGGSGAAIAAGLATVTTGTDTGGSIRIPASLCGVVGLKPTYGRVSKAGVMPLSYLFDHPGPITRTVEDAALLLAAIAGYDADDPVSLRAPVDDYGAALSAGVRGVRVGVPRGYFAAQVDDEVGAAFEAALGALSTLGASVKTVELPGVDAIVPALFGLVLAEAQQIHAQSLRTRRADFGADVGAILDQTAPDTPALLAALRVRDALTVEMRRALEGCDVLATPATPIPAPRIGQESVRTSGVDESVIFALIRFTAPFNATGLPALSLPCGFTRAGLPIGLQLVGRPLDEATVLRAGHAYEQATDWHLRAPPGLAD